MRLTQAADRKDAPAQSQILTVRTWLPARQAWPESAESLHSLGLGLDSSLLPAKGRCSLPPPLSFQRSDQGHGGDLDPCRVTQGRAGEANVCAMRQVQR